jgi:hypothetical protein
LLQLLAHLAIESPSCQLQWLQQQQQQELPQLVQPLLPLLLPLRVLWLLPVEAARRLLACWSIPAASTQPVNNACHRQQDTKVHTKVFWQQVCILCDVAKHVRAQYKCITW